MSITPTLEQVAAPIRARTLDSSGAELGTFTDDTRPTDAEVEVLIAQAVAEVTARVGPVPTAIVDAARAAVVLRTGQLIERSFYPEQSSEAQPAYLSLRWQFEDALLRLVQDAQSHAINGPLTLGNFTATNADGTSAPFDVGARINVLLTVELTSLATGETLTIGLTDSDDGVTFATVADSSIAFTATGTEQKLVTVKRWVRVTHDWTASEAGDTAEFTVSLTD